MSAVKKPTTPATPKTIRGRGKARARMNSSTGCPLRLDVSGTPRRRYSAGIEPNAPHVDLVVQAHGASAGAVIEVQLTVDEAERLGTDLVEKARAMRDAPIDDVGETVGRGPGAAPAHGGPLEALPRRRGGRRDGGRLRRVFRRRAGEAMSAAKRGPGAELLHSALTRMGYRATDANRAISALGERVETEPLADMVREALAILSQGRGHQIPATVAKEGNETRPLTTSADTSVSGPARHVETFEGQPLAFYMFRGRLCDRGTGPGFRAQ